jgi:hypothetical protein
MVNAADAALLNTTAGMLGVWTGGFLFSFLPAYILLRIAGSPKRRPVTAAVMRAIAVLFSAFLAYAGYVGGGYVNVGSVIAFVVILAWALYQRLSVTATPEGST